MGPIRCPETSVKEYHSTLRNTPEERLLLYSPLKILPLSPVFRFFDAAV
jgi:hypothetical protein